MTTAIMLTLTDQEISTLVQSLICYIGEQKKLIKFAKMHGIDDQILVPRYNMIKWAKRILRGVESQQGKE